MIISTGKSTSAGKSLTNRTWQKNRCHDNGTIFAGDRVAGGDEDWYVREGRKVSYDVGWRTGVDIQTLMNVSSIILV